MELGVSTAEFLFFLLLSFFFALIIIHPSDAIHSAGFTIPRLFAGILGDERSDFVEYHLRRTLLTAFVHASIPFICFAGLEFAVDQPVFSFKPNNLVQWMALLSVLIASASAAILSLFCVNNWERHPLTRTLKRLSEAGNWQILASDINNEVRAPLLYSILYKDCLRVLVTAHWLLKITNYNVKLAPIHDCQLVVIRSAPLQQDMPFNNNVTQPNDHTIDLRVRPISGRFDEFMIRIRSQQELDNLRDQLGRPIDVINSVTLPQPMHDRFVDVFLVEVERNPRLPSSHWDELEPCLGCSQTVAQVKLLKRCTDSIEQSQENCRMCACRPMWCARCMGRIFASKQDQQTPEIWMAGRAPCPTCRATFCVVDVCLLDQNQSEQLS